MTKSKIFSLLAVAFLASTVVYASIEHSSDQSTTPGTVAFDQIEWGLSSSNLPGDRLADADKPLSSAEKTPLTYETTVRGRQGDIIRIQTGNLEDYYREHPEANETPARAEVTITSETQNRTLSYADVVAEHKQSDDGVGNYRESILISNQENHEINHFIFDNHLIYEKPDPTTLSVEDLLPLQAVAG